MQPLASGTEALLENSCFPSTVQRRSFLVDLPYFDWEVPKRCLYSLFLVIHYFRVAGCDADSPLNKYDLNKLMPPINYIKMTVEQSGNIKALVICIKHEGIRIYSRIRGQLDFDGIE